jgi:ferredoxin, 2Fe-2S
MPKLVFIENSGARTEVEVPVGVSVMEAAHMFDVDIEGACEGVMACSTCHVIVDKDWYGLLAPVDEDEDYMLDLAMGLTDTSRLGCQIVMTDELDGLVVRLPAETQNMML